MVFNRTHPKFGYKKLLLPWLVYSIIGIKPGR